MLDDIRVLPGDTHQVSRLRLAVRPFYGDIFMQDVPRFGVIDHALRLLPGRAAGLRLGAAERADRLVFRPHRRLADQVAGLAGHRPDRAAQQGVRDHVAGGPLEVALREIGFARAKAAKAAGDRAVHGRGGNLAAHLDGAEAGDGDCEAAGELAAAIGDRMRLALTRLFRARGVAELLVGGPTV